MLEHYKEFRTIKQLVDLNNYIHNNYKHSCFNELTKYQNTIIHQITTEVLNLTKKLIEKIKEAK